MSRGGPGARRRLAELSERSSYRLNGVQRGSRIAMCLDRFARWDRGVKLGTLMRQTRDNVWILWDHQPDFEVWSQGDARYEVDRGRWRITGPGKLNPLEAIAGVSKSSLAPSAPALTSPNGHGKIDPSPHHRGKTEGRSDMAEQSTLSAKQVATKLGTDAKTFRRFLRSNACTVEPVGQGGRYEFSTKDVGSLKDQFSSWRNGKAPTKGAATKPNPVKRSKTEKPADPPKRKKHTIDDDPPEISILQTIAQRQQGAAMANDIEKDFDEEDFDREPTADDLAELEDLDLDDIDA